MNETDSNKPFLLNTSDENDFIIKRNFNTDMSDFNNFSNKCSSEENKFSVEESPLPNMLRKHQSHLPVL